MRAVFLRRHAAPPFDPTVESEAIRAGLALAVADARVTTPDRTVVAIGRGPFRVL